VGVGVADLVGVIDGVGVFVGVFDGVIVGDGQGTVDLHKLQFWYCGLANEKTIVPAVP
jgi:hypothetical protein